MPWATNPNRWLWPFVKQFLALGLLSQSKGFTKVVITPLIHQGTDLDPFNTPSQEFHADQSWEDQCYVPQKACTKCSAFCLWCHWGVWGGGRLQEVGPTWRSLVIIFLNDILGSWLHPCLLPVHHEVSSSALLHASCHDILPHHKLKVKGSSNHGLKPLNP